MSDVATGLAVEQPQGTEQVEPAPLSVMEHAKLHGETAAKTPEAEKAALEEKAAHHSEAQRREKETGRFDRGKHRAESQKARAEDVPRINALTARAKSAEERLQAAEGELARLRAERAPAREIQQAERRVEREEVKIAPVVDAKDPEPQETDQKYATGNPDAPYDYGKYLVDQARWAARDERRQEIARERHEADSTRQREAEQKTILTFGERVTSAKERYGSDYDATLTWDVPWLKPDGKPYANGVEIDNWVMKHKSGPDVLHYLRQHPDEVNSLATLEPFEQIERLALLSQRFDKQPATAGITGAATRTAPVKLPPRPATPVRTEAMSVGGAPPTDGTLSVMDHAKKFKCA